MASARENLLSFDQFEVNGKPLPKLKVDELKHELASRGLEKTGLKKDLQERLFQVRNLVLKLGSLRLKFRSRQTGDRHTVDLLLIITFSLFQALVQEKNSAENSGMLTAFFILTLILKYHESDISTVPTI